MSTCTSFYKKKLPTMLSQASVLARLSVHMHVLLREKFFCHVSGCCETFPGLSRVAFQLACPTCHTTCLPLCGVFATHEHPFKHARTQRGPKKNTLYDCNTHTSAMQKNALHVSVSFQPRALARKPGPTERPGSGLGWLRLATGHRRTSAPLGRGAAIGIEHGWKQRQTLPEQEAGLLTVSCLCRLSVPLHVCLLALLASNMPQNEPTHRPGTLRFDCIFQTCQTEDGVAIFKHATNKAATRSTKTCWNVLRPRQTQSSQT